MMQSEMVYITDWGFHRHRDLPESLRERAAAARFTKSGRPDRRSPYSVAIWAEIQAWSKGRVVLVEAGNEPWNVGADCAQRAKGASDTPYNGQH